MHCAFISICVWTKLQRVYNFIWMTFLYTNSHDSRASVSLKDDIIHYICSLVLLEGSRGWEREKEKERERERERERDTNKKWKAKPHNWNT